MKKISLFLAVLGTFMLGSCSHVLTGTWTVQKYETLKPGEKGVTLSNIGTITFQNNGNGEKNISYALFDLVREDNLPFKWTSFDSYITIESENSEFAKLWIVTKSKRKAQVWKTTDGANEVKVLELVK
jgi:hypothetical protein